MCIIIILWVKICQMHIQNNQYALQVIFDHTFIFKFKKKVKLQLSLCLSSFFSCNAAPLGMTVAQDKNGNSNISEVRSVLNTFAQSEEPSGSQTF